MYINLGRFNVIMLNLLFCSRRLQACSHLALKESFLHILHIYTNRDNSEMSLHKTIILLQVIDI